MAGVYLYWQDNTRAAFSKDPSFVLILTRVGHVGCTRGSASIDLGAPVAVVLGVALLGDFVHSGAHRW